MQFYSMETKKVNYALMIESLKQEIEELQETYERITDMGMNGYLTGLKLTEKKLQLDSIVKFAKLKGECPEAFK